MRPNFPVVLLVNDATANAAEIMAGAMKDWNRAIILGDTTVGRGSAQTLLPLSDGSALRLTTARFYTPGHKLIQDHGVVPSIKVQLTSDQERALLLRRRGGGYSVEEQKLVNEERDVQLERAVDALKGVMVYTQSSATPAGG